MSRWWLSRGRSAWMLRWRGLLLLLLVGGCGGSLEPLLEPPAPSSSFDLATCRLVELSHPFDASTLYWPTSPSRFEIETLSEGYTEAGFFYLAKRFATPEHGGTHLDAPIHFAEHGWSLDEIPLERLVAPAVVVDVSAQAAENRDYQLTVADLDRWEAEHGAVPAGGIVLLRTGWSSFWPDEKAYYGRPDGGEILDLHFPSYGPEAARLLVEERRVAMLGVDTASIDYGPSGDFLVHQIATGANVPALENVANLDQLPPLGAWVVALPPKIAGGSGGPARILGLVPR